MQKSKFLGRCGALLYAAAMSMALAASAMASPVCPDGVVVSPDAKYNAAKMPKLPVMTVAATTSDAVSAPVAQEAPVQRAVLPMCGPNTPCPPNVIASGGYKCKKEHLAALPVKKPPRIKDDPDE